MAKDHPDHHDAEIVMRLYDLRRETVMRESRDALNTQFWPRTYEDVLAVTKRDHELNRPFRQVGTFVQPYLENYRRDVSPLAFRNAEWVAVQSPEGRAVFATIQARVAKLAQARAAVEG